jgi:MerR family transcriptional regulator/heat shock protein HspR
LTSREQTTDPNSPSLAKYTMGVAVMMTGVPAHRIRTFECSGLCKPARTPSNQRMYSDNDIGLIRQIATLDKEGVNIPGIKAILNLQQSRPFAQPD